MSDHTKLTAVDYPTTYLQALSPAWLHHAAVLNGATTPLEGPFRYLELGCGQGLSTIVHAAAFPAAQFHACDVSSSAMAWARHCVDELQLDNLTLHQASFAELAERELPTFDYVVAHGVYTWVAPADRAILRELFGRLLTPTGLAYVSYNCQPGWGPELPLRRLLMELAASVDGDPAQRAAAATRTLHQLAERVDGYFASNPEAAAAAQTYASSSGAYLAHELLAADFAPLHSVDVAIDMAAHGLELLGSATLPDNHRPLLLADSAAAAVDALATPAQRQLAEDLAVNRRFRRDLFVPATAQPADSDALGRLVLGRLTEVRRLPDSIRVPRGLLRFEPAFLSALEDVLSHGPAPMGSLVGTLARTPEQRLEITRNLLYLTAAGTLSPFAGVAPELHDGPLRFASTSIERSVQRIASAGGQSWVPSPVSGCGVEMNHLQARELLEQVGNGVTATPAFDHLRRLGILSTG